MEKYGIYFYFEQSETEATLVLCDGSTTHGSFPGFSSIPYSSTDPGASVPEHFYGWVIEEEVESSSVKLKDYNYQTPKMKLLASSEEPEELATSQYERYEYPGGYRVLDEGEQLAAARVEALECEQAVCYGTSDVLGLACGYTFSLTGYPRKDQNKEYLTTELDLYISTADFTTGEAIDQYQKCQCRSKSLDSSLAFRPALKTPKPRIRGPQTATVTGAEGTEVDTDDYGNVFVQFHWDLDGANNEQSSCPIRVSQHWAGSKWGTMWIPHVGCEVVVSFEDGDPDRPLITGRVYNENQMPTKNPELNPMVGYIEDSSQKNSLTMDATQGAEKLTIINADNQIDMSATGDERIKITDGKNYITFDPTAGKITTHNDKFDHYSEGDWSEWTWGSKVSNLFGLYWSTVLGLSFSGKLGLDISMAFAGKVSVDGPFALKLSKGWELSKNTVTKINDTKSKINKEDVSATVVSMKRTLVVTGSNTETTVGTKNETVEGMLTEEFSSRMTEVSGASNEVVGGTRTVSSDAAMAFTSPIIQFDASTTFNINAGQIMIDGAIVEIG